MQYAQTYLDVGRQSYRRVWYNLWSAPDAQRWQNVLLVSQLLFSLPFSTAKVERLFSQLKLIKTDRRTRLNQSTISDLLEINAEGPADLLHFSSDLAVELWWSDCSTIRREKQQPRKKSGSNQTAERELLEEEEKGEFKDGEDDDKGLSLDDWDNWFLDELK